MNRRARSAKVSRGRRSVRVLGWSAAFALGGALGIGWYVQRPSFRAALLASIERQLEGSIRGRIELAGLTHLGLSSVRLERLEVLDERGVAVLALEGINVRFGLLDVLGPWLPLASPMPRIEHVRIERSRVRLASDPASGDLTLVRALSPPPHEPRAASAPLLVSLGAFELGAVLVTHDDPALSGLVLRVQRVHGQATLGGDQTAVSLQRFGLSLRDDHVRWVDGAGSLSFGGDSAPLVVGFHGFVRGTELDAHAELRAGVLTARLDVPRAEADTLRAAWPSWPLRSPVTLHLNASGPLGAVALAGSVASESSTVELGGTLGLSGSARAQLELRGHALDARLFSNAAPTTSLELRAELELRSVGGALRADGLLRTEPTRIGALQLPPIDIELHSEAGVTSARAELVDERGRLQLSAELAEDDTAQLEAHLTRASLAALVGGSGQLDLSVRGRWAAGTVGGSLSGHGSDLRAGALTLGSATLDGSFSAPVAAFEETRLGLNLVAEDVAIGPIRLARARISSRGRWDQSQLQAEIASHGSTGNGSARFTLRPEPHLSDLEVSLNGGGSSVSASASVWDFGRGRLNVERIALSGAAGSAQGQLRLAPGELASSAEVRGLDAARAGAALGIIGLPGGTWSGRAAFEQHGRRSRGELELAGERVRVESFGNAALTLHGSLEDRHVEFALDGRDPTLGELTVRARGELGGSLLEPAAWQDASGTASASLAHLPLWPLAVVLGDAGPVRDLDGKLGLQLTVERPDAAQRPDIFLEANTEALTFNLAPELGAASAPYEDYALHASASIDGRGERGYASARIEDAHGPLASASAALSLDVPALASDPSRAARLLLETPIDALLRLHPRAASLLPPPLAAQDLAGNVEATLELGGTLAEPRLSMAARARNLLGSVSDSTRAVDLSTMLQYAAATGRVQGYADVTQAGQGLVVARLEGRVPPLLELPRRANEMDLRAAAMLNGVPLELWPTAARERLEARLYGSVELHAERNAPARERAHIEIAGLSAQGQRLGNGRLTLEHGQDGLHAELRVGTSERFLHADVRSAMDGAEVGAVQGALQAKDFDAASLSPLTSGLLSRLGGDMNADLEFSLRPTGADDWYLGIDGDARLHDGSAHIQELGLEVREIDALVRARSTPTHTVLLIDPLSAKARSRVPNIQGDAELWLRGLRVENGEAKLTLNDVPLSLKGVSRGIARGNVKARLSRAPDHLELELDIPELRVRLPASSTRSLIALDENPELRVLQDAEPPERRDPDALRWQVHFNLGRNVRVQRGDLDVPIAGHPTLEFQYDVRPSGTIEAAPGGRITLFNQTFSIDRGLIQLDPDAPDNPRVDVTASWRAPDGTTVYVDVTGRADDATVLTRDDRGLQDVERFYLITGGALADGTQGGDGSAAEAAALGQTVSLGINELLRNALGNVAVSIGATPDDRASYSASVRLTDKLTFQGSFLPGSENNLQQSTNDLTGTLDYRFSRRWSLRTELGTSGGAFDLLWSHRY